MNEVVYSQVTSKAVTVAATAPGTLIVGKNVGTRRNVLITNNGAATLYIGQQGVTTTSGTPIVAGASLPLECGAAIYGICASSTLNVRVLEIYPS